MDATHCDTELSEEAGITDPPEYAAFKVGGGDAGRAVTALEIRARKPLWFAPAYRWHLYTLEDGEDGTFIAAVFSSMQIYIRGRFLRPVAAAIRRHRCAVLWEYNPQRWPAPVDKAAPFIESITVHLPQHAAEEIARHYGAATADKIDGA